MKNRIFHTQICVCEIRINSYKSLQAEKKGMVIKMKKIPTLFLREFENHRVKSILPEVTVGMEWVLEGEGIATIKWDGSCCAIIDSRLYRRYDAKKGKAIPANAILCMDAPDLVTGHFPCWVECSKENPSDRWYIDAWSNTLDREDATYEAVGPQFQKNPYNLEKNILVKHGRDIVEVERTFECICQLNFTPKSNSKRVHMLPRLM